MRLELQTLSYRPGLIRAPVSLEIGETGMRHAGGAFHHWTDLTGVHYASWRSGRVRGAKLVLTFHSEQEVIAAGFAPGDPAIPVLMKTVLTELASARPGMSVQVGAGKGLEWAMFVIGVVSALLGLGILGAALASGVSTARLMGAALPILLLGLVGYFLLVAYRPWRDVPPVPVEQLIADL
ncbi:hypothetical protein [Nioella ostreopsis]|uniref:hypothetical protein n=1 Tax=Nioella ostreopsis TaxID=2448479 RepID=UPI000FDA119C|nr:hypothetical protein [Nioella ostreopsis]